MGVREWWLGPDVGGGSVPLSAERGRAGAQRAGQLVGSGDLPGPGGDGALPPRCCAALVGGVRLALLPAAPALCLVPAGAVGVREPGAAGGVGGVSAVGGAPLLGPSSAAPGRFGLLPGSLSVGSGLRPGTLLGGPATLAVGSAAPPSPALTNGLSV